MDILPDMKVGFLRIGRKRGGFDAVWGKKMEDAAWGLLQRVAIDSVRCTLQATDDLSLRQAVAEVRQAKCDVLVVIQPTVGDGRLTPRLNQQWDRPVIFWGTPENPNARKVSSCSLVGTHNMASLFAMMDHPFEVLFGDPENDRTRVELENMLRITVACSRLKSARIGLIGYHVPGFINMVVDPIQMGQDLGCQLHHIGLQEFIDRFNTQNEQDVSQDVRNVMSMGIPLANDLQEKDLAANSRYYLTIREFMKEENLAAIGIRCWPELPNAIGHWPYLSIARLCSEGLSVSLEGDVDGAITGLVGKLLGAGVGCICDWLEHDERTITLWHPGHAPMDMCKSDSLRLSRHFNSNMPAVVDAKLLSDMPVTMCRFWRYKGEYRIMAAEAKTCEPSRELCGAYGVLVLEDRNVFEWFRDLCHEGMPHHVSLFKGHHGKAFWDWARLARLTWIAVDREHVPSKSLRWHR